MTRTFLIALAVVLALSWAAAAEAAPTCNDRTQAVEYLTTKWSEAVVATGVTGGGKGLMEIWTSDNGETWTLTLMSPDGRTCLFAEGTGWLWMVPRNKRADTE